MATCGLPAWPWTRDTADDLPSRSACCWKASASGRCAPRRPLAWLALRPPSSPRTRPSHRPARYPVAPSCHAEAAALRLPPLPAGHGGRGDLAVGLRPHPARRPPRGPGPLPALVAAGERRARGDADRHPSRCRPPHRRADAAQPAAEAALTAAAASRRLAEQLAADQHAADLAGAGADLVELGVAQQPPGRVVVDVAVAAEDLDRVERDLASPPRRRTGWRRRRPCAWSGRGRRRAPRRRHRRGRRSAPCTCRRPCPG